MSTLRTIPGNEELAALANLVLENKRREQEAQLFREGQAAETERLRMSLSAQAAEREAASREAMIDRLLGLHEGRTERSFRREEAEKERASRVKEAEQAFAHDIQMQQRREAFQRESQQEQQVFDIMVLNMQRDADLEDERLRIEFEAAKQAGDIQAMQTLHEGRIRNIQDTLALQMLMQRMNGIVNAAHQEVGNISRSLEDMAEKVRTQSEAASAVTTSVMDRLMTDMMSKYPSFPPYRSLQEIAAMLFPDSRAANKVLSPQAPESLRPKNISDMIADTITQNRTAVGVHLRTTDDVSRFQGHLRNLLRSVLAPGSVTDETRESYQILVGEFGMAPDVIYSIVETIGENAGAVADRFQESLGERSVTNPTVREVINRILSLKTAKYGLMNVDKNIHKKMLGRLGLRPMNDVLERISGYLMAGESVPASLLDELEAKSPWDAEYVSGIQRFRNLLSGLAGASGQARELQQQIASGISSTGLEAGATRSAAMSKALDVLRAELDRRRRDLQRQLENRLWISQQSTSTPR